MKFPAFYVTQRFIVMVTRTYDLALPVPNESSPYPHYHIS